MKSLPTNFTPDEYKSIMSKVNPRLYKKLRETFIVITDDVAKVNRAEAQGATANPADEDQGSSHGVSSRDHSPPLSGSNQTTQGHRGRGSKRLNEANSGSNSKRSNQ